MNILKKWFTKNKVIKKFTRPNRERLKLLYYIETDKAKYYAYNTQTVEYDWVNIEIEKQIMFITKLILQDEIADDSWGCMGGESWFSLVMSSKNHLKYYIKSKGEFITFESELL